MITLDDLTAMMATDEHHRYEISPEGVLSIKPLAGYAHAVIATRLNGWLLSAHVLSERIAQAVSLRIPGKNGGVAARVPDLTVWSTATADGVWLPAGGRDRLIRFRGHGHVAKRAEDAAAGIPRASRSTGRSTRIVPGP